MELMVNNPTYIITRLLCTLFTDDDLLWSTHYWTIIYKEYNIVTWHCCSWQHGFLQGSWRPASRMLVQWSKTGLKKWVGLSCGNGSSVWVQATRGQTAVSVCVWFSVVRWILAVEVRCGRQSGKRVVLIVIAQGTGRRRINIINREWK